MRIDAALPMHIARAYALKPAAPAQPAQNIQAASQLIAARVERPVDFNAATPAQGPSNVFQLYNRAADKVEAAVAVQAGRQLDVKG